MLQALTDRERRTLLAILAVLALGAVVKLWRWKAEQKLDPVPLEEARAENGAGDRDSMETAFVP